MDFQLLPLPPVRAKDCGLGSPTAQEGFLKKLFADGGYQGPVFAEGVKKAMKSLEVEIVKRSDAAKGFEFCRCAGWSSAPSAGTVVAGDLRKTTSA